MNDKGNRRRLVPAYVCDECGTVTNECAEYVFPGRPAFVSRLCLRCDARIVAADEYQRRREEAEAAAEADRGVWNVD